MTERGRRYTARSPVVRAAVRAFFGYPKVSNEWLCAVLVHACPTCGGHSLWLSGAGTQCRTCGARFAWCMRPRRRGRRDQ